MTTPIKYQGDPKLYADEDGVTLRIVNGNTTMERGAANHILIALLTDEEPKHINALFDNDYEKIKPHYQRFTGKPITSTNLQDRVSAAKADLKSLIDRGFAEEISAIIENTRGTETRLTITIDGKNFVLTSDSNSLSHSEA
jgi:hypothetical protein